MNRIIAGLLAAATSASAFASLEDDIARIIEEGKNRNQAYQQLLGLTAHGPRLTGSPQALKASEWAAAQFRKFGCTNVHLEQWGEMPVGFYRGPRQVAKMVAPFERDFVFTTPAWSPGTDGPMRGHVVREPASLAELESVKSQLKGAWVLMNQSAGMRPNTAPTEGDAAKISEALDAAGILGRVYGTNDERVHTGGRFTGLEWGKLPTQRRINIRKSDYDYVKTYAIIGQKVELMFDIDNRWVKGPIKLYNVIADIKGTEKPDEMVIVCGHLDSWNGPGSVGANDNGTGTSVAIEAARILSRTGVKPKRTIRFILWTGEEQGLLGSRAYVEKHRAELPKIAAVLNDDGGTNYQGGYNCLENMKAMLDAAIAPVQKAFPHLPMENTVVPRIEAGGSSDHAPFAWEGIPSFFTKEKGRADYGFVWHTQNDRPENSIPEYMAQSSTNHAAVAYYLACHDEVLPKFEKPVRNPQANLGQPVGNSRWYMPHSHSHDDGHDHDDDWWDYVSDTLRRMSRSTVLAGR